MSDYPKMTLDLYSRCRNCNFVGVTEMELGYNYSKYKSERKIDKLIKKNGGVFIGKCLNCKKNSVKEFIYVEVNVEHKKIN